jgi:hypothetical protein
MTAMMNERIEGRYKHLVGTYGFRLSVVSSV